MTDDGENRPSPSRRRVLASVGSVVGTGALARCDGDAGDEMATDSPTPTDTEIPTGTTTNAPSPTATETPASASSPTPFADADWAEGGPPDRDGWSVTFADRFDQGSLDWDAWEVGFGPYNDHDCAAAACARRENVSVDGETNRLVLTTTPDGADEIPNSTWLADYTTGAVCTASSFQQTFGYFEAKARMPSQPGALAAFWAWSDDGNPPEVDFYESFGPTPNRLTTTIHIDCNDDGEMQGRGARFDVEDRVDETFHTVGCAWGPEAVTWHLDGREVHHVEGAWIEDCHDPEPLFPILNTHVGGREDDFIGPDAVGDPMTAEYPYTHEFEWVRAWQHEGLA